MSMQYIIVTQNVTNCQSFFTLVIQNTLYILHLSVTLFHAISEEWYVKNFLPETSIRPWLYSLYIDSVHGRSRLLVRKITVRRQGNEETLIVLNATVREMFSRKSLHRLQALYKLSRTSGIRYIYMLNFPHEKVSA